MAQVDLTGLWVQPTADPADVLVLEVRQWNKNPTRQADSYPLADGGTAVVVGASVLDNPTVDVVKVSRIDLAKLESWLGTLLQWRDRTGRQVFAVLAGINEPDGTWGPVDTTLETVTLQLAEATYSVAV